MPQSRTISILPGPSPPASRMIERHIIPAVEARLLHKLTALDLDELYRSMIDAGLSARTVRYAHAIICKALGDAVTSS